MSAPVRFAYLLALMNMLAANAHESGVLLILAWLCAFLGYALDMWEDR